MKQIAIFLAVLIALSPLVFANNESGQGQPELYQTGQGNGEGG